tara:strand:- start:388 stop:870 length:483 start_codon:yes stop_codon:yes gene_type:complete
MDETNKWVTLVTPKQPERSNQKWTAEEEDYLKSLVKGTYESKRIGNWEERLRAADYDLLAEQLNRSVYAIKTKCSVMGLTHPEFFDQQREPEAPQPQAPQPKGTPTSMRLPDEWIARADRITDRLNEDGRYLAFGTMTRDTVLRLAVQRGLESLGAQVNE